jgi:hypothetical protein|tara:strand:- start:72 stop:383 length:312 start_codon:yes stop_codon:yes gene_type:complete
MKITKRQLRRIIREEKSKLLNENRLVGSIGFGSNAERQEHLKNRGQKSINEEEKQKLAEAGYPESLSAAANELFKILDSMSPEDRNPEIYMLIDDLEDLASGE